jgi:hypothetical protein
VREKRLGIELDRIWGASNVVTYNLELLINVDSVVSKHTFASNLTWTARKLRGNTSEVERDTPTYLNINFSFQHYL